MITENEWNYIAKRVFSDRSVKAPACLWTRVLAGIEEVEQKRAVVWWMQWDWMSRVTAGVAFVVFLAAGLVYYQAMGGAPLETLLRRLSLFGQSIVETKEAHARGAAGTRGGIRGRRCRAARLRVCAMGGPRESRRNCVRRSFFPCCLALTKASWSAALAPNCTYRSPIGMGSSNRAMAIS